MRADDARGEFGWLIRPRPEPRAKVRLICFPYSGGSSAVFRSWVRLFDRDVEVVAVEMPGRGRRRSEKLLRRITDVVEGLIPAFSPLFDRPYALFGHSLGAFVVFSLLRRLRETAAPSPACAFVAGIGAPVHWATMPRYSEVSHDEFVHLIRRVGGTADALLTRPDVLHEIEQVLRADLAVCESCSAELDEPFDTPLTAFGADDDPMIPLSSIHDWVSVTTAPFRSVVLQGGHFFLHSRGEQLAREIRADLEPALTRHAWPPTEEKQP